MAPTLIDTDFNWPYTAQDLTLAVAQMQNEYGQITDLGIFADAIPLATRVARIRYANGKFHILAATSTEGTPSTMADDDAHDIFVAIPHFPVRDKITINDIQDRVARGGKGLETLEAVLARKLQKIDKAQRVTWEYLRVGALFGLIRDGSGRVLYDLFDVFEVDQKTIHFDLANPNSPIQDLCWQVSRHMEDNAHGEVFSSVRVKVSKEFMTLLSQHPKVRETFLGWSAAEQRTGGDLRRSFPFGGLTFEEYNGSAPLMDGTSARFIPANEGVAIPIGTTETFAEFDAPPVNIAQANLPPETKIFFSQKMLDHGRGVEIEGQSNTLPVVTRPDLVVRVAAGVAP
jgi:hypothetical protein